MKGIMGGGGTERASFSWWWDSLGNTPHHPQWLQSTLSEVEQNINGMLTLIQQEDEATSAQRAEMYYQKKPELMKNVQEFHRLYCSLAEYCSQLSVPSSLSSSSTKQLESFHGGDRVVKLDSPDSIPKSSVEDPELECCAKSITGLKSPRGTENGFSSDATDKRSLGLSEAIGLVEDHTVGTTDGAVEKKSGISFSVEMVGDSEIFHSLEQKISCSEHMLRIVEDSCRQLNELTRRNEERRETNKELMSQIEKLMKDNHTLLEQHTKLVDENGALNLKLQKLINENCDLSRCSKVNKQNKSQISRLKALLLSTFWGGDPQ